MLETIKQHAQRLHEQGLAVIPTGANKNPLKSDWQNKVGAERVEPNGNFKSETVRGVGLPTGHKVGGGYLLAIDVDCYDKLISRDMCDYISETLGVSMPYRIGERPKFLVPVLCDETTRKITSKSYTDPLGLDPDVKSRIEVLGLGQQFVAYGAHPKAKNGFYEWHNGDFNLDTTPTITLDKINWIIERFEEMCEEAQLELTTLGSKPTATDPDDFMQGLTKSDDSPEQMREILSHIPASDEGIWFQVGAALHHQFDGSDEGLQLFDEWSKTDPVAYAENDKADGTNYLEVVWDRYNKERSQATTWKGVCDIAKRYGADLSAIARKYKESEPVDFSAEVEKAKQQPDDGELFQTLAHALTHSDKTVYWTIEDIVERKSLMNFYGESGVGKSYLAIDLGLSVATGTDWNGKRTKAGKVVYVAGEGHGGVVRRGYAWGDDKGIDVSKVTNFVMTKRALNLTSPKDVANLERELDKHDNIEMVIIDTWGRATSGINENLGADVQPIIERLADTVRAYDCTVCVVHHTPKHSTDESAGSKNMKASMDVEMALIRKKGVQGVVLESRKMKEGEPFEPMVFKFIPVDLPEAFNDEYGKTMRSAVLRFDPNVSATGVDRPNLSPNGKIGFEAFKSLLRDPALHIKTPNQVAVDNAIFACSSYGIDNDVLRAEIKKRLPSTDSNLSASVTRAITDMVTKGYVANYQADGEVDSKVVVEINPYEMDAEN